MTSKDYIQHFNLKPHPEGGYFAETYRSAENIPMAGLPSRFTGDRSFATAIYFLLTKGEFSAFHRIKIDECWHFYAGDPLNIHIIDEAGNYSMITLGADINGGQVFQYVVPAGAWFASHTIEGGEISLVGCTVSPGFDFADFEMADKKEMLHTFPQYTAILSSLCR